MFLPCAPLNFSAYSVAFLCVLCIKSFLSREITPQTGRPKAARRAHPLSVPPRAKPVRCVSRAAPADCSAKFFVFGRSIPSQNRGTPFRRQRPGLRVRRACEDLPEPKRLSEADETRPEECVAPVRAG